MLTSEGPSCFTWLVAPNRCLTTVPAVAGRSANCSRVYAVFAGLIPISSQNGLFGRVPLEDRTYLDGGPDPQCAIASPAVNREPDRDGAWPYAACRTAAPDRPSRRLQPEDIEGILDRIKQALPAVNVLFESVGPQFRMAHGEPPVMVFRLLGIMCTRACRT